MNAGHPSASTGLVVLLGDPVRHSVSPAIHNAAFREQGVDLTYLACPVAPDGLADAMRGLWALGAVGANVTLPHKRAALEGAETASATARALRAANTLVRGAEGWHADNTDVAGFLASLGAHRQRLAGGSAVVLGAGGAARAVVYAIATTLGMARLAVVARRLSQAEALIQDLDGPAEAMTAEALTFEDAAPAMHAAALVVNATPLGMGDGRSPWPHATDFHDGQIVYDLVYRPRETPLLRAASRQGAITIDGLPMLIAQAAGSYRQWTGRDLPLAVAQQAALDALAR